jgi:PAS domain S-box-containing protein
VPGAGLVVLSGFGEQDRLAGWREQSATDLAATAIFLAALGVFTWLLVRQLRRQHALTVNLAREEARYRRLLDTANEGIWKVDTERRTVLVNRKVCAMFGYNEAELMGRNPFEFVIEDDKHLNLEMIERRRRGGTAVQYDLRYRRKDGSVLWTITSVTSIFDESGVNIGSLAMLTDITERALAEQQLKRNFKHLEALFALDHAILNAHSRQVIAATGLRHLRDLVPYWGATVMAFDFAANLSVLLGINRQPGSAYDAGEQMSLDEYGRADIAALAQGRERVVTDMDVPSERSPVLETLYAKGMRSYVRIPLLAEGEPIGVLNLGSDTIGAYTPEQVALARTFADQIAIALRQASLRSQVERQAADLERRVVERTVQLEAVNKELEAFSYSVSHDLRAPVRRINGFANLLLEDAKDIGEDSADMIRRMADSARNMAALIDDMLTLATTSSQPLTSTQVDMAELVRSVVEELTPAAGAGTVAWKVGDLPPAFGDQTLIRVVLQNLIANAVKYSSRREGARVEVDAQSDTPGGVTYFVRDNGAGFDMRHAHRLFNPFSRLHDAREFEGTGIGLATVRRIINRHGGRIWAEAEVGRGATFYFQLPAG